MGQKVNPRGFRQATTYVQPSRWFASKQDYAHYLQQDVEIRKAIRKKFRDGGVARVEIERSVGELTVGIHTSKPGVVIGRGGALIDELKKELKKQFFGSEKMKITVNIHEVQNPDLNAEIIYQSIRDQLEARVPFRRAMKRAMQTIMRSGAKGARLQVSGRLNGADIARTETISEGRLPLHTLRANIDYTRGVAQTIYGVLGIKVWVYKGDIFTEEDRVEQEKALEKKPARGRGGRRKKKYDTGGKKRMLRKKKDVDAAKSETGRTEKETAPKAEKAAEKKA